MTEDAVLQWARVPVQGRSERTLARLLDATERLLEARSFDRITVADIVKEANASVGSFYARFDGKDSLFLALWARYDADARATADETLDPARWSGVALGDAMSMMCAFLVSQEMADRGFRRAMMVEVPQNEQLRSMAVALGAHTVDRLTALLMAKRPDMTHPDPALAAHMVHRLLFSVLDQIHTYRPDSPTGRDLTETELSAELARAVVGYLGIVAKTE